MSVIKYVLSISSKGIAVQKADETWDSSGATLLTVAENSMTPAKYDGLELTVSLCGINVSRKVYEPGHIQAELLIVSKGEGEPKITTLRGMLLKRTTSLTVQEWEESGDDPDNPPADPANGGEGEGEGGEGDDPKPTASYDALTGYYIHEISPLFEQTKVEKVKKKVKKGDQETEQEVDVYTYNIYTKLDMYSLDKLLTLNKYSQAHLGKKLIADIVSTAISSFKITYAGQTVIPTAKALTLNKIANTTGELVQPYLIQYNETFYDFIRRVCNRCGEVFYYEGGTLNFGLPTGNPKPTENPAHIMFQQVTDGPLTIHDYARDAVKGTVTESITTGDDGPTRTTSYNLATSQTLISDPIEKKDGFPLDAFATLLKGEGKHHHYFYNSEIASEDHYILLYKGQFSKDTMLDLWWGKTDERLMGWLSDLLNSTSLMEFVFSFAQKLVETCLKNIRKVDKKNSDGFKIIKEHGLNGDNSTYAVLNAKVTDSPTDWLTLDYYHGIKKNEEAQMHKMVCVEMSDKYFNVSLGDSITIPNDDQVYVVVGIDMNTGTQWSRNYDNFAGNGTHLKGQKIEQSQRIYAIPKLGGVFYPPLLPEKPFRQSGPQPAFVIENEDPTGQGRVRIRFPWQPSLTSNVDKASLEQNGSPWIRMSTSMATTGGGVYFRPEVGDEVMVDFENGNVERPYVTGCLYSKNVHAPDQGERVIVSKNGHTIKLDDPDDASELLQNLYPGFKYLSGYGVKLPGLEGKVNKVLGGIEMSDQLGFYNIKMSAHERNISISSPFGDINVNALTGISIEAPNGDVSIVGKNVEISAYNKITMTSGKNVKMGVYKNRSAYVSSFGNVASLGKTIGKTAVSMLGVNKFFDLSLIRTLLEIFVRPVDGTLEIKSNRYLLLESGKGSAMAEASAYNTTWEEEIEERHEWKHETPILEALIRYACDNIDGAVADYVTSFNAVVTAYGTVCEYLDDYPSRTRKAYIKTPANRKDLLSNLFSLDIAGYQSDSVNEQKFVDYLEDASKFDFNPAAGLNAVEELYVKTDFRTLAFAVADLRQKSSVFCAMFDTVDYRRLAAQTGTAWKRDKIKSKIPSDFLKDANSIITMDNPYADPAGVSPSAKPLAKAAAATRPLGLYGTNIARVLSFISSSRISSMGGAGNIPAPTVFKNPIAQQTADTWATCVKRRVASFIIEKCRGTDNPFSHFKILESDYEPVTKAGMLNLPEGSVVAAKVENTKPKNAEHPFRVGDWAKYVNNIRLDTRDLVESKFLSSLGGSITDPMKKVVPWESDAWKSEKDGEILFSVQGDKTIRFSEYGPTERYFNPVASDDNYETDTESLRTLLKSL